MKPVCSFLLAASLTILAGFTVQAADSGWAGQYADKKFLGGKAVFQLTIEQSGSAIQVSFDAAHNDAHGAAPEGQGAARVSGKDTLEFKFEDSFGNAGTGTIKRAGDDIILSMKTTRVKEARCLVFYQQNMRLKRAGKK
ncbi:MAG: hypothetical protein DLM73_03990 [Chthoniobacterales bacterium]|nr:MAG: hypothetical protein DLM73_03990 [Chthoniobacterales bacterium]